MHFRSNGPTGAGFRKATLNRVYERITEVLAEQFEPERGFTPDTSLIEDLHADELDRFELAIALETEFAAELGGREISEEEVESFVTVEDAVEFVRTSARER